MKRILPFFLMALILFSSCTKYQFASLKSPNLQTEKQLTLDNEMFSIEYEFTDKLKVLSLKITNKTKDGFYINWEKSALIYKDQKISGVVVDAGDLSTNLLQSSKLTFVPAQSFIIRQIAFDIEIGNFHHLKPEKTENVDIYINAAVKDRVKKHTFAQDNSPLQFKYLLCIALDSHGVEDIIINQDFWINEVIETKNSAILKHLNADYNKETSNVDKNPYNKLILTKGTDVGNIFLTTLVVGGVVGAAVIKTNMESK